MRVRGRDAPVRVWFVLAWPAGQSGKTGQADALARDGHRLRQATDDGRLDEADALLDGLARHPPLAGLCRWQRSRLRSPASPLALDITLPPA